MNKWQGYKKYDSLLWKVHNHNLFSFKPDNDEIVQSVYYLNSKNRSNAFVTYSEIGQDKPTIVCEGDESTCKAYWDALCDERVDPKMGCSASFTIT